MIRPITQPFKVPVGTGRTQRQIPVNQSDPSEYLGVGNHPAFQNQLPVQAVTGCEVGGRELFKHPGGNTDCLTQTTKMAAGGAGIGSVLFGASAEHFNEPASIAETITRYKRGGVPHHISPFNKNMAGHCFVSHTGNGWPSINRLAIGGGDVSG